MVGWDGGVVAGHLDGVGGWGHAGALADAAVNCDDTVVASAHAAVEAPWRTGWGVAEGGDAGGGQGGGDGFACQRLNRLAVEVERDRPAGRVDGGVGEAHGRSLPETGRT